MEKQRSFHFGKVGILESKIATSGLCTFETWMLNAGVVGREWNSLIYSAKKMNQGVSVRDRIRNLDVRERCGNRKCF